MSKRNFYIHMNLVKDSTMKIFHSFEVHLVECHFAKDEMGEGGGGGVGLYFYKKME